MNRQRVRRQGGFSLLEVLVAFAIMTISLGLIYRSLGSSADAVTRVSFQQQATLLIQSLLQSRQYVGPDGWTEQGQTDALQWQVSSRPVQAPSGPPGTVQLHEVSVTVSSRQQPPLQTSVQTLRPQETAQPPLARP